MQQKRKRKLKNAILIHIANSLRGELLDWGSLKIWLGFEFKNKEEEDMAESILLIEIKKMEKRIVSVDL